MKVPVQYFSGLKDITGTSQGELELPEGATVDDLLGQLYAQTPKLLEWDSTILVGAGLEFVRRDHVLRPNEEISLMPPVQGG